MEEISTTKIWADAWYGALACGLNDAEATAHANDKVARVQAELRRRELAKRGRRARP